MATSGSYLIVKYDVPGPELWHERLVTATDPSHAGSFAVVTPGWDHHVEEISITNEDIEDIRAFDRQGGLPAGIQEQNVYRFDRAPTGAELTQLLRDGALLLGVAPPAAQPPVAMVAPVGALPRAGRGQAARHAQPGRAWVASEDYGTTLRGDVIDELPPDADAVVINDRALVPRDGGVFCVQEIPSRDIDEHLQDDLRVIPVKIERGGRRRREFTDSVARVINDEPEGESG